MYSGIRLGMLLGLVFLLHVRCSGNIVGSSLNLKSGMGNNVRPQETLGQDHFQTPWSLPSSSHSLYQSQGTHSSLVAPGLVQPMPPYGYASSNQVSSLSKNVWPASSSSSALSKMGNSEYPVYLFQYSSGSEPMKPYASEPRSNIANPSIVSSGVILLNPETKSSQDFVEPNNPSHAAKRFPQYRSESKSSYPYKDQAGQSSRNIWAGTTTFSSIQSEALFSSRKTMPKTNLGTIKPSRHHLASDNRFLVSSGAGNYVDVMSPSASVGQVLKGLGIQRDPVPKGASSAIGYGFESTSHNQELHSNDFQTAFKPSSMYPVQNSKQTKWIHLESPIQHPVESLQTGSKASSTEGGVQNSKCTINIPSPYGKGSIRRCSVLNGDQGLTNPTFKTLMSIFSQKRPTGSSFIVPDATPQQFAVQNAKASVPSSQVNKLGDGVEDFSARMNGHSLAEKMSIPALPSSINVHLLGVDSLQSNMQPRCEKHGNALPSGSYAPSAWNWQSHSSPNAYNSMSVNQNTDAMNNFDMKSNLLHYRTPQRGDTSAWSVQLFPTNERASSSNDNSEASLKSRESAAPLRSPVVVSHGSSALGGEAMKSIKVRVP